MVDVKEKIASLRELAKGSIFFPFTEPKVKSPVTGKQVSGDYDKEFYSKKINQMIGGN